MDAVLLKKIHIGERQRELDPEHVGNLKESILTKGLLHPIVLHETTDSDIEEPYTLVAGRHRLESISQLHSEEKAFLFDGVPVEVNHIPAVGVVSLSAADLAEAELEENILHAQLNWKERARALTIIAELREKENPKSTNQSIAREIKSKGDTRHENVIAKEVRDAKILSEHLENPAVSKARNATEALGIVYKNEEAKLEAEQIRRNTAKAKKGVDIQVHHGDLTEILPTMDENIFDLIVADLPYGIGADTAGFRKRTVEHHNYTDDKETAEGLMKAVIVEGFRVAKLRANMFIFGDVDLFPFFKAQCAAMGWKPYRTPIIWQKSKSEGLAPWGREGPRRTYEMIFFATKGKKGLLQSPVDILSHNRVPRNERRYGAEKPVSLLEELLECSTMPGDNVLDPCCGSGSTLAACRRKLRRAQGIELDEAAYNLALVAATRELKDEQMELEDVL